MQAHTKAYGHNYGYQSKIKRMKLYQYLINEKLHNQFDPTNVVYARTAYCCFFLFKNGNLSLT